MATRSVSDAGAAQRADWAKRHPERARAERQIRKGNVAALKEFGHKVHGTPETHAKAARVQQGALARLYEAGDIDLQQLVAANSIVLVHARITSDVAIGTCSYETRVDQSRSGDGLFFERLGAVRAEVTYSRWRQRLADPAVVLAMIVDDIGVSVAAARFGMRNATAKRLLVRALDLWDEISDGACRDVDPASLAAAQAGIL